MHTKLIMDRFIRKVIDNTNAVISLVFILGRKSANMEGMYQNANN